MARALVMRWTVVLLSDRVDDVRDLLPSFPLAPFEVLMSSLKDSTPPELSALSPDILLLDALEEVAAAEEAARRLTLEWSTSLPPLLAVLSEATVSTFRFESGVDDFLFGRSSSAEISARFAMAARRVGVGEQAPLLKVGDLVVNPDNYQVHLRNRPLDLTYKEFELLKFLAQRGGRVCDRGLLLQEVWGYDYFGGTRTVDVHVRRLRAKLGPEHETLIETIRNVGYRLVARPRER
ncbi:MAG: response regulator transcription factor [Actinomycetota bacterium]|nr:response regulator transcription factor [Actinomycetota bacterium]